LPSLSCYHVMTETGSADMNVNVKDRTHRRPTLAERTVALRNRVVSGMSV